MRSRPTIAMLVPAFNAAGYLPRLLESAARQTEPFDEIWVYDDCSTDDTAAIAERYGANVVRGDVNRGCTCAKNRLAASTEADWLHFHDADDELGPTFVALARRWMAKACADVVLFPYEERDDATGNHMTYRLFDGADVARDPRSYAIREQINPFCGLYRPRCLPTRRRIRRGPARPLQRRCRHAHRTCLRRSDFRCGERDRHHKPPPVEFHVGRQSFEMRSGAVPGHAQDDSARRCASATRPRLQHGFGILLIVLPPSSIGVRPTKPLPWRCNWQAPAAAPAGEAFKALCRVSPQFALRAREWLIRGLRPRLRENYPGWRAPVSLL